MYDIRELADMLSDYIDTTGKDWWSAKDVKQYFLSQGINLSLDEIMQVWNACPNPVCACELLGCDEAIMADEDIAYAGADSDDGPTTLYVEYYTYGRYGTGDQFRKGNASGETKLEALKKIVDHMSLYLTSEDIEEEGYSFDEAIDQIAGCNGDGCDYIILLENRTTGEIYIQEDYEPEEEEW